MAVFASKAQLFTVEKANAALPLVRAIVSDVSKLAIEIQDRKQRLAQLTAGRDLESGDPYDDELVQVERDTEKDEQQLLDYVKELTDLGVELRSAVDGLIDFPAQLDSRLVYLCWRLGEPEVLYWHEVDAGFSGRQELPLKSQRR